MAKKKYLIIAFWVLFMAALVMFKPLRLLFLIIVLLLAVIGLTAFFTPLTYTVSGRINEANATVSGAAAWLFRFIRVTFGYAKAFNSKTYIAGFEVKKKPMSDKKRKPAVVRKTAIKKQKAAEKKNSLFTRFNTLSAVLTDPDSKIIMSFVLEYIMKSIRNIKPKHLRVEGVFGFNDPSVTGCLLGAYEALAGYYGLRSVIRLNGEFNHPVLRLDWEVRGWVSVFSLAGPLIWLVSRKAVFNALVKWVRKKR
jgi:ribosomal protein L14